jgi:aryl-alcohol dehydrogenase-like predicted oxidoreductase
MARTPTKTCSARLAPYRDRLVIATKFGFGRTDDGLDSRPENIRAVAEASLKRLRTDHIDLFYQHRVDPKVPIEDVAGTVRDLIAEGKVGTSGCPRRAPPPCAARMRCSGCRRAEYSLWWREPERDCCPCRSWASASCPSARWAAAS